MNRGGKGGERGGGGPGTVHEFLKMGRTLHGI